MLYRKAHSDLTKIHMPIHWHSFNPLFHWILITKSLWEIQMASNRAVTHYITQQGNPIVKDNLPAKLLRSMSLNEWKLLLKYHGVKVLLAGTLSCTTIGTS